MLEDVFRIVSEQTRQPVENPVARVLKEGRTVGLANHMLLVARDGSECPIDDSAAPNCSQEGEVIGCVLVFRDVTQQRRAKAVLLRQTSLLEQTHDAIFVWEFPGRILSWNQAAEILYGFSKEEAPGKVSHDLLGTVELAKIVQQAVEMSRPLIEAMSHDLTLDLPPTPIFVDGDLTRLAQVFANLLNNAARYTERGGRISLQVGRRGSDALVSVQDTGVGIPAHMLPKVFDVFTQVDHSLEQS